MKTKNSTDSQLYSLSYCVLDHTSGSFQLKIKEAIHIQREQPSSNQQVHHVSLKACLHGMICRPDNVGAGILRVFSAVKILG